MLLKHYVACMLFKKGKIYAAVFPMFKEVGVSIKLMILAMF